MRAAVNIIALLLLVAATRPCPGASLLINDGFTSSLSPWIASGSVFNTGDTAVLSDSLAASSSSIFQSVAAPSAFGGFEISFDVFNGLSPTIQPGNVQDVFFATVYLGGEPFGNSLSTGNYSQSIPLFDMDHTGGYNLASGASFGPSPKGSGWTRYSVTKMTAPEFTDPGYMTVAFEFFNLNGASSDSVVAVDNVYFAPAVPEPGRALLLTAALCAVALRRRR